MIDLSFLTEAEQEAILKVLNRDAELKKAEDERVKNLQDVVDDENEFKYKSGQWFYDAKSKRHRDKIHGAELVRASIRKRKKPATIAELSKLSQDSSKRRWVNSVNQDIFIPPELYGVMEAPDEAEEDVKLTKQEGNQSSKKVSFSPEKEPDKLRNGTLSPPKPRQNPFNSEGLQDEADFSNEAPSPNPDATQMNGTEKPIPGEEPLYAVVNKKTPEAVVNKKTPEAVVNKKTPEAVVNKKTPEAVVNKKTPEAVVSKTTPAASSPSQQPDFDLDDALGEPGLHGQRGKTQNIYLNEKPLEFGKSFSGRGKITFESSDPNRTHKERCSFSSEELTPEKARNTETSYSNVRANPVAITQVDGDPVEPVERWRRHLFEKPEPRQSSPDFTKDQKTSINIVQESPGIDVKAEDTFGNNYPENQPSPVPGKYSEGTKYKSVFLQNRYDDEHKPVGLTTNLPVVQNVSEPSKSGQLDKSLLHENKERKDLPKSSHFNVMSLKERINEMPREQMSNPSQFQSLKHFWNVEEKNLLRVTTVTSPDKILTNVSSRSKPIKTDVKQRSSEIPADEVIFPNTLDNLSEEEQTSQKVASWLAQTPTVYVDGQMDQNEDLLHSGEEIAEHVQKSTIHKKSDEEFANALQKLREEASEVPKVTERSRTEVQMVPQGKPELVDHMQTTIRISPTSQNSIDTKAPVTDFETTDRRFHERVVQISNKMDQNEDPLHSGEEIAEHVQKSTIHKKSDEEFANALQKLREEASEVPKITERSRTEEVQMVPQGKPGLVDRIQTTATISPTSQNSIDSKAPATDFEMTNRGVHERVVQMSNKRSPAKETLSVESKNKPFEEKIDDAVAPEKSASEFSIPFEKFDDGISYKVVQKDKSSLPNEENENETEEVIERSAVPKSQDQQDFISSLKKLEIEASKPPLPDVEAEYRDGLPEEEIRQNTVSPVKSSFNIGFEQFGKPTDHSVESPSRHSYVTSREPDTEETSDLKEIIEKSTVPSRKDNEDLSIALRKLELEAIEPQSDEEYDVGINQEVEFEKPKSQLALQTNLSEDHSDINLYSHPDGKTVDDLDQPPEVSPYSLTPKTFEGPGKRPVAEEQPVERTKMDSQESAGDFHRRLMQLEEQAKIPEEPEDSLVDDAVHVSQFPNREAEIPKKVYSRIESMPTSIENSSENGKAKGIDSPRSKPKDLDLKSHNSSPYKELANYPQSPEPSGSYTGFENMPYKKPEVGSPEVSNSKPGKPAQSESPSDTASFKNDRYEFEVMKAQDESISKVLDWFSRSSEIGDKQPLPVDILKPSKGTSSQMLIQTDEKESGPNEINLRTGPTPYPESPNTSGKLKSRLSVISTESGDHNSEIPHVEISAPVSLIEEDSVPTGQINLHFEDRSPLQYGKSGGGSGKKLAQETNAMQDDGQFQLAKYLARSEEGLDSEKEPKETLKQNLLPLATESMSNQLIPEMVETPHSRLSLGSTEGNNDQPELKNDELLTEANSIENNGSPPRLINSNIEAGNCLEFGKSGGGSGKASSPSQDISEDKKPRLSLSSTDIDDEQSDIKHDELLTQASNIENPSPPRLINSNLEVGNCLEFGKSGVGSGKISSPCQEISEDKKSRLSLSSTESTDHVQSESDAGLMTPVHVMEEESVPPAIINLEAESGGVGSGTTSNQAASNMNTDLQLQEVNPVFDKDEEKLKDEKESVGLLNYDPLIPRVVEAETPNTEKGQLDGARDQKLKNIELLEGSASQDAVKLNAQQRRVSDIKQIWEGDRSDLPAAKKTILSSSKRTFSSSEKSVTPRSSSVESDDQSSPSLVTFKKVIVEEEEENKLSPIDQLKTFWENEKNKEAINAKPSDSSTITNGNLEAGKVSASVDSRSKFQKRHTFHSFFETEQSTRTDQNPPGRSVSVSESTNYNPKDQQKSTTFQNLRSFWNVDNKAKSNTVNPNDRTLSESKNKQFRSNPDLSKESFVARIKSKLDSQSLVDIREDTPATYQVQPVKDLHNRKNKAALLKKFSKEKSNDSSSNSVEVQENGSLFQSYSAPKFTSVPDETQPKSKSPFEVSEANEVSEVVVKSSQRPEKMSEFNLRLQKLSDEFSTKKTPEGTTINSEFNSKNEPANRDVENQNFTHTGNGDKMHLKEYKGKPFLVKQIGFDATKTSVDANASHSPKNSSGRDSVKNGLVQVDNDEQVHETVEKTQVSPPKHSDFDKGLQQLYNESLKVSPVPDNKVSQKEFMNIQSPEENFSKVLTVSSSKETNPSFQQPIILNLSSKKINFGNEEISGPPSQPYKMAKDDVAETLPKSTSADLRKEAQVMFETPTGKQNVNLDEQTEASIANKSEVTPEEKQSAKEIVERMEMPTIVPKAPFNCFDEGLKKLYDESRDLTATKEVSHSLQALPAKRDSVNMERASSVSQAPDILEQEIGGTIEKASAPTQIYQAKSSEQLQKEAVNDQEEPFIDNVPSNHVTSEESQPRFSENAMVEGTVSEMSPKGTEASVEEKVGALQYEESQESPSRTSSSFTDMSESTPLKEKNNSLRKSTLELYLEAPYRREMSKSMDFELDGYVASDVDKEGCMDESHPILRALKRSEAKMLNSKAVEEVSPTSTNQLNSSNPTEHAPVNSFPQNADTLKRMSQSVPSFLQDETDGRDTDSASESSFQIGRHKKSPSSLTNLSGSSGMASMSSVSGSVMSIYSGDFGNVDIKGGIEFSVEYVEQLKEFLIYIYQCRDLAVAEVKKQRSDPYVKAYLLPEKAKMGKRKTAVKKKTLNPVYNEILRYKIPKLSLLAQTLNLSVWHHDALGRNSFLGEVNLKLGVWDWSNTERRWYQLEPRTPAAGIGLENRGEMKLSVKYVPLSPTGPGSKPNMTGEVYIWIRECLQLPMLRENKINSFVKCTVLPDTSRKSRQKTRTVDKTPSPIFNHTMVYDGFKEEDLREACVELTVWDHNRLSNHFLGGLRIGLGTGKSYGTAVDWMDSTHEETTMWEKMMASPNTWVEGMLPLRMFKMAKLTK